MSSRLAVAGETGPAETSWVFRPGPGSCLRDFAAMYRFEDGKIAERWAIRDELGMLKQLGAFDADPG